MIQIKKGIKYMALVTCKYCGKQVSDKAVSCPHCGAKLIEETPIITEIKCEECGATIPDGANACPSCGCPIPHKEETSNQQTQKVEVTGITINDRNKKQVKTTIVCIFLAILAIVAGIFIYNGKKRAAEEAAAKAAEEAAAEYISNLELTVYLMLSGASEVESACGLIHDVWANTLLKKSDSRTDKYTKGVNNVFTDDFKVALTCLFWDGDFDKKIQSIKDNKSSVESKMKELKNPPDKHKDAHKALMDLYEAYSTLVSFTDPGGIRSTDRLNDYTDSFNKTEESFIKAYERVNMYFE